MATATFFLSWPTWAKLSFVLGGSLVIVLMLAGMVKVQKMIKIRKLTRKSAGDPEMVVVRLRGRSSDEIPFGAKAMLEDPDVEGVWNSRASTPLQSPVLKPRRSSSSHNPFSRSRRNSSASSSSRSALPDNNTTSQPIVTDFAPPPGNLDGTFSSAASALENTFADISCDTKASIRHYSDPTFPRRRSFTIRAIPKQDQMIEKSDCRQTQLLSVDINPYRRARVSTDLTPATPTHERRRRTLIVCGPPIDISTNERTPKTRKALDRMEAHRKFHAAESGQLQPRLRNPEEKTNGHKHSASESIVREHEPQRAVSWPVTPGEVYIDFNAQQQVQTKTSPHIVPFTAIVETHVPPKENTKVPPSAWTERTQGLLEEKLEALPQSKMVVIRNNQMTKNIQAARTTVTISDANHPEEITSLLDTRQYRSSHDSARTKNSSRDSVKEISRPNKLQKKDRSRSRESRRSSLETVRRVKI